MATSVHALHQIDEAGKIEISGLPARHQLIHFYLSKHRSNCIIWIIASFYSSCIIALSEVSLICSRTLNSPSKLRKVFKVFSKSHWQKHIKTRRRKKTLENTVHNWNVIKNMVKCESMHRICAETLWKLWGPKCIKMPAVRFDHDSDAWLPERQPLRKPLRWKKAMLSTTGG